MRLTLDEAINKNGNFSVVCGGGDDSTMMIAELYKRGYEPDYVVFCDTGCEMPHTYKFMAYLSKWMMERNWSKLIIQKKHNANGDVINVFDENYKNGRMPPVLYGFKTCSQRFKIEVANKFLANAYGHSNNGRISWKGWDKKIVKCVGLNADEQSRIDGWISDDCFEAVYPLVDFDVGERESESLVYEVGLYMPGKSSCFMCPNMTAEEIVFMHDNYPLMFHKAIDMEKNVTRHGNDFAMVSRVFVEGDGISKPLPTKMTKKTNRAIDLDRTLSSMSQEVKISLGLASNRDQHDLFDVPKTKLVIKKVKEPTNFIGLARSKSWLDVLAMYQMTGQLDLSVGGEMCASGSCGL